MYYNSLLFVFCMLSYTKSYIKYTSSGFIRYKLLKKGLNYNFIPNINMSIMINKGTNNTFDTNEDWESGEVPWNFTDKNIDSEDSCIMMNPSFIANLF